MRTKKVLEEVTVGSSVKRGHEHDEERFDRVVQIADKVRALYLKHLPKRVVYERVAFGAHGAVADLADLAGFVRSALYYSYAVRAIPVTASQARKAICGKSAGKMGVAKWAKRRKLKLASPDALDALVVGLYALQERL